jgi:hypothetical protein
VPLRGSGCRHAQVFCLAAFERDEFSETVPVALWSVFEEITALTAAFCLGDLDEEYVDWTGASY